MKKIIITSILSSLICVASFGQSLYRTILSHNGQLTQYNINHWTDAITDAVEGDTVYFTPGYFPGSVTITKAITLIGAGVAQTDSWWYDSEGVSALHSALLGSGISGQSTTIGQSVIIDIDETPTLTTNLLEGLKINNEISIKKSVNNLSIKRCHMSWLSGDATCSNLNLGSCRIGTLYCGFMENPYIYNCYFNDLQVQGNTLTFNNISFVDIYNAPGCTFINCIDGDGYYNEVTGGIYINCLYESDLTGNGTTYESCWQYEDGWNLSKDQLTTAGYIGNDGKVIGPLGGSAPFTLIPSQPYVSSQSVTYDAVENKLNVNITVKKGK